MDNKELYAAKTKDINANIRPEKIILKGTRNHQDGLYDIPICKTSIQEGNYKSPQLHGGLCKMEIVKHMFNVTTLQLLMSKISNKSNHNKKLNKLT